jgi:hypothetical protein
MTPKEKAQELVTKFKNPIKPDESYSDYNVNHIACALIAVDEIIIALNYHQWQNTKEIDYYRG